MTMSAAPAETISGTKRMLIGDYSDANVTQDLADMTQTAQATKPARRRT